MTARLKHAMKDQRQGEGEYGQSFDTGLGGLFQTSLEGRVLSANPAMARILGYESPEELTSSITGIGKQAYVHPEDRERLVSALTRERAVVGFECEVSRKDRRRIWVSISARLACSDAGEPLFVEGFLMDITERKLAQDEVRQLNVVLERRVEERTRQLEAVTRASRPSRALRPARAR